MSYRVEIDRSASKALAKIERRAALAISAAIRQLADDPRPDGAKKLVGRDEWRIRVRDWRIIYTVRDEVLLVRVVKLGHRRDIYR